MLDPGFQYDVHLFLQTPEQWLHNLRKKFADLGVL